MRHFDIIEWTDFVRGLITGSDRQAMVAHLDSGCSSCAQTMRLLSSVVEVARTEAELSPPAFAVRAVKSSFRLAGPVKRSRLEPITLALRFDSARAPAPVGIRSERSASRQLLYRSEDYALDLRIDYDDPPREVVLMGEVLDRRQGPLADVPAFLMAGEKILSSTVTRELGEFSFRFAEGRSTRLKLLVEDERWIDLAIEPAADVDDGEPDSNSNGLKPGDPWAPQEPS